MVIVGSLIVLLLANLDSSVSNNEGNNNKLDTIANKSVTDTKPPRAFVPPKLETVNTKNPKNRTMDV